MIKGRGGQLNRLRRYRIGGYTLVELLVAMVSATILIAVIFSFTTSMLQEDRKQEAIVQTQEEITAALNYIAADLQEAVFIYGGRALELPHSDTGESGIGDQIPYGDVNTRPPVSSPAQERNNDKRPILVFWKRKAFAPTDTLPLMGHSEETPRKIEVRCLGRGKPTPTTNVVNRTVPQCFGQSRYLYSLVVYYLMKDKNPNWSDGARLGRWEIMDGIKCDEPNWCVDGNKQESKVDGVLYEVPPSPGFKLFSLTGTGTVAQKMSRWQKSPSKEYDLKRNPIKVLIDHLDDTPYRDLNENNRLRLIPVAPSPERPRTTRASVNDPPPTPENPYSRDCDNPDRGVGVPGAGTDTQIIFAERTPTYFSNMGGGDNVYAMTSFFACVANYGNPNQTVARVWMRGAAYSRYLQGGARGGLNDQVLSDIRVLGRGLFNLEE
ncbi:MAG: hypothetical protein ACK4QL_08925 [Pseudanabaenaceae cyanobacterium]